jgi:hypothetical protein
VNIAPAGTRSSPERGTSSDVTQRMNPKPS